MKIKTITALGLAAAFLIPASAMAQTFTSEAMRETQTTFGAPSAEGPSYYGSHSTGTSTATMADGTKVTGSWACIAMSQPPGIFAMHLICENTSESGNFTSVYGCNPLGKEGTAISCVGGMRGKSGDFEGKTGSSTILIKGADSKGTGQWH